MKAHVQSSSHNLREALNIVPSPQPNELVSDSSILNSWWKAPHVLPITNNYVCRLCPVEYGLDSTLSDRQIHTLDTHREEVNNYGKHDPILEQQMNTIFESLHAPGGLSTNSYQSVANPNISSNPADVEGMPMDYQTGVPGTAQP